MTQEERWYIQYEEITNYIRQNRRRPSKHRTEDHKMLNWLKYNRKLMLKGELPENRVEQFKKLLQLADRYRKLNQHSYKNSRELKLMFQTSSSSEA